MNANLGPSGRAG